MTAEEQAKRDRIAVLLAPMLGAIVQVHAGISDQDILRLTDAAHEAEYQIELACAKPAPVKAAA